MDTDRKTMLTDLMVRYSQAHQEVADLSGKMDEINQIPDATGNLRRKHQNRIDCANYTAVAYSNLLNQWGGAAMLQRWHEMEEARPTDALALMAWVGEQL